MNRHDQQVRDDLAMRLFVGMVIRDGQEYESGVAWRHRASLVALECFAWARMFMEERALRHRKDHWPRDAREEEEEIEL